MNSNIKEMLALGIFDGGSRMGERVEMLLRAGRAGSARMSKKRVAIGAGMLLVCVGAGTFAPRVVAQRIEFEVASVKPLGEAGLPDGFTIAPRRSGDRIRWITTAELLVLYAYNLPSYQLAPEKWLYGAYDVEAKLPAGASEDEAQKMFQALLEDRFKLKVHWQKKEMPEYALTVARGGPKLKEWTEDAKPLVLIGRQVGEGFIANYSSREDPHHVAGRKVSAAAIATYLANALHGPVVDKTGLSGLYDFELVWTSEERALDAPDPAVVSDAMQRQLGLKLDAGKGRWTFW